LNWPPAGWFPSSSFFGDAVAGAVPLTQILVGGAAFVSVQGVLSDGSRGAGYAGLGTIAEAVTSISLLPLIAVMASAFGSTGVAWE
jgi:O-antigen/teichoic acid export membrane protein